METNIKKWVGFALMFALVVGTLAYVNYVHNYGRNADVSNRTFAVTAEGKSVAVPDVAEFTFSVLTEGGLGLADLQKQNTDKSDKAIAFLKDKGVDDKDITTTGYQVDPRYQYQPCVGPGPCAPPRITGYTVTQTTQVKSHDFNTVGDLLSGVVTAGANSVSSLTFTRDNPEDARNEARADAMAKARDQAQQIAKAGGFHLGRLVSVSDNGVSGGPIAYGYGCDASSQSLGLKSMAIAPGVAPEQSVTVQPGSQDVTVNMTLIYEID